MTVAMQPPSKAWLLDSGLGSDFSHLKRTMVSKGENILLHSYSVFLQQKKLTISENDMHIKYLYKLMCVATRPLKMFTNIYDLYNFIHTI